MGTFRLRKAGERGTGRVALACHEDNALALARIGSRYTAGERVRPQIGCERLDCGKRDHLTADLGEALRTPLDGDETVGVDGDDITGVVPTVRRTFKHSGVLRAQISEHYVGPTYIKPSTSLDACDRFKPHFHARQDAANGSELVEHRRVERQCRRGFGHTITLEDAEAEFLHVGS